MVTLEGTRGFGSMSLMQGDDWAALRKIGFDGRIFQNDHAGSWAQEQLS